MAKHGLVRISRALHPKTKRFPARPLIAAVVALTFLPCFAAAATIAFVGAEEGLDSNGYTVQNWSNPGVAKQFSLGGTQVYGTSGYYQIRPISYEPTSTIYTGVSVGNDLGISADPDPTLYSAPLFLNSITGEAGTFVNFNNYAIFRGPDGSTLYTQGALSVPVNQGPYNTPSGNNSGYFGNVFSFAMAPDMGAEFRIGVAVDAVADSAFAPNYVSLYSASTGTVYSSELSRNGNPDIAFFDVTAAEGESIFAAVWQLDGTQGVAASSLITFDVIRYRFNTGNDESVTNSIALGGAPGGLLKAGEGTLTLSGSNSYTGATTISGGRLLATTTNSLGDASAALTVSGGAYLDLGTNITRTGAVTFDGGYLSTDNGSSLTKNGGSFVLSNAAEIVATLGGTAGLTRGGAGHSVLWSSNTYTGPTVVTGGALRLDGAGNISSSTTLQVDSAATFSMTGESSISNDVTVAGLTNAGTVYSRAGTLTVNVATNTLQSSTGKIEGGIGLTLAGATQLSLSGSNSYTGGTVVGSDNVLFLADANGLGSTAAGTTVVTGGVLRLVGTNAGGSGIAVGAEALSISGLGRNNSGGALRSVNGTNTWQGKVTLAADARIGSASGSFLTLDVASGNAIEAAGFNLSTEGAGRIQVNDPLDLGTGSLTKLGTGSLILAASNSYSGGTTVSEGVLVVSQSSFTASITSNSITAVLSSVPVSGATYQILPGSLAGSYPAPMVSPLSSGQSASFDTATGILSIIGSESSYDSWAIGYGLDPATDGAPAADPDGDAFNNNSEYAFGTSPVDATAALVGTSTSGGNLTVSWMERDTGLTYAIQSTEDLKLGFADDPNIVPATSGDQVGVPVGYSRKQFTVPATGRKFFRIRALGN